MAAERCTNITIQIFSDAEYHRSFATEVLSAASERHLLLEFTNEDQSFSVRGVVVGSKQTLDRNNELITESYLLTENAEYRVLVTKGHKSIIDNPNGLSILEQFDPCKEPTKLEAFCGDGHLFGQDSEMNTPEAIESASTAALAVLARSLNQD